MPGGPRAVADAVEDEMPDVLDVEGAAGGFGVGKFDGVLQGGEVLQCGGHCGTVARAGVLLGLMGVERGCRLAGSFAVARGFLAEGRSM